MQSELHDARRVQLCAQHAEALRRLQIYRWIGELHHVERVEELRAKGRAPTLCDAEFARNGHIDIPAREAAQLAAGAAGRVDAHHGWPERVEDSERICEKV